MIRVTCDNCEKELKEAGDKVNPNGQAEKRVSLRMHVEGTQSYPLDWDLCVPCAKKVVARLKEPM